MTDLPGRTPHTPIAVNIEMWFEGSFVERIEQAAALGFPAIELWTWRDKDLVAGAAACRGWRPGAWARERPASVDPCRWGRQPMRCNFQ